MDVYVLTASWGEYSDHSEWTVGVFSSMKLAGKAEARIKAKADRNKYPWSHLDDGDMNFHIQHFKVDQYEKVD